MNTKTPLLSQIKSIMKKMVIFFIIISFIYLLFFYESPSEQRRKEAAKTKLLRQKAELQMFLQSINSDTKFLDLNDRFLNGETTYERRRDATFIANPEKYLLIHFSEYDIHDYYLDDAKKFVLSVFAHDSQFKISCKENIFKYIEEIRDSRDDLFIYGKITDVLYDSEDDGYPVFNFSCEKLITYDDRLFYKHKKI